ncbi:MAG: hypothetical protein QM286_04740 [Acidobacteriota bacterium]|nr:hypothetical protein [Acidobacteriota bacterium]
MIPEEWIAQRRGDGEVIGYIEMTGDEFRPYDLLGRPLGSSSEWDAAETAIEQTGLSFLADPHLIDLGVERRVRLTEVTREHVVLVADEFGAAQAVGAASLESWVFDLPITVNLRPLR